MHRAVPVASRECTEKWQERSYKIHRQKLQKIKTSIDNKPPPMYPHLYQKLKKAQMEEERCSEIERDNRTLVRRMTEIMQRSALDTRNAVEYRSLNKNNRRKELIRITQENQSLLRRIQRSQPTYNHLVWEQERDKNEVLCERICRYPYRPMRPNMGEDGGLYDEDGMPIISSQTPQQGATGSPLMQHQEPGYSPTAMSATSQSPTLPTEQSPLAQSIATQPIDSPHLAQSEMQKSMMSEADRSMSESSHSVKGKGKETVIVETRDDDQEEQIAQDHGRSVTEAEYREADESRDNANDSPKSASSPQRETREDDQDEGNNESI